MTTPALLRKPLLLASSFLLVLGIVFMWIQNTFYGYIDENNVLQDSLFLPLGALSIMLGLAGFFFLATKVAVRIVRSH